MDRNASIHGLRGFAVLAVFLYHVHRSVATGGFGIEHDSESLGFLVLESGRLGVDLFFLISGYLITGSLLRHRSAGAFLWSRALRIYPAFLPLHLLLFSAGPLIGYAWMADLTARSWGLHFVSNLLFLPGVFELPIAQIVAWSLSYEAAFYLLAASCRWCVLQRGTLRRGMLCTVWCIVAGLMLWQHPRAWFFVAGAAAYGVMRTCPEEARRLGLVELLALLLMAVLFEDAFALAVVCGFVAFLGVAGEAGTLARLLRTRPLQFLGDVSYSFYLWHAVVLYGAKQVLAAGAIQSAYWNVAVFTIVSAAGSVLAAYASWRLIERRTWLRRVSRAREADAIAVWRRALARTRLEASAQSVTMERALDRRSGHEDGAVHAKLSAGAKEGEAARVQRERGGGAAGDRAQAGDEEEDTAQAAAAVCADRP